MSNTSHHKFINPLCSVNNTISPITNHESDKFQFYNCVSKEDSLQNKWTCYGPYLKQEEAIELKGVSEIKVHKKSIIVCASGYLPPKVDIMKTLVLNSFPEVEIKSVETSK